MVPAVVDAVAPAQRERAKAVNFGIVYGQTPFGLAASINIDRKEAETYIRTYFELWPFRYRPLAGARQ